MRGKILHVLGVVSTIGVFSTVGCSTTTDPSHATVTSVVDGDTVEVRIQGQHESVRLLGIDTPETVHPSRPVECFGPEASAYVKQLLPVGSTVIVRRDKDSRDRFGRMLVYLFRPDSRVSVNEQLLSAGMARTLFIGANTSMSDQFRRVEAVAKRDGRGLWGTCDG